MLTPRGLRRTPVTTLGLHPLCPGGENPPTRIEALVFSGLNLRFLIPLRCTKAYRLGPCRRRATLKTLGSTGPSSLRTSLLSLCREDAPAALGV